MSKARPYLCFLFLWLFVGCSDPTIELYITTDASIPQQLDTLHINIWASSSSGHYCEGVGGIIEVDSERDLPVYVLLEQGGVYTQNVMYEITASANDVFTSDVHIGWSPWPDKGETKIDVNLSASCFGITCDLSEHCGAEGCEPLSIPYEFINTNNSDDRDCMRDE